MKTNKPLLECQIDHSFQYNSDYIHFNMTVNGSVNMTDNVFFRMPGWHYNCCGFLCADQKVLFIYLCISFFSGGGGGGRDLVFFANQIWIPSLIFGENLNIPSLLIFPYIINKTSLIYIFFMVLHYIFTYVCAVELVTFLSFHYI